MEKKPEIVCLNKEAMTVDFDSLTVEDLEVRLELAIAAFAIDDDECGTNCCGTNCMTCDTNNCGTNCF